MKKALISGCNGQDGSYLSELLLSKGYEVHGLIRRASHFNRQNIEHIVDRIHLHYGDMSDTGSIIRILKNTEPDEIYHLAAQSHVQISSDIPDDTYDTNGEGTRKLLDAVRCLDLNPCIYNAATSELFGGCEPGEKLSEESPMHPRSPYAISKLAAYWWMRHYREAYGLKTWNGILFNHESPRRGENFITRKITLSIARMLAGKQGFLEVGNMEAKRDWGYAPDYVNAMWMMLQSSKPDDYIVATGETHSVREFIDKAFSYAGISDWSELVRVNPMYVRPVDVECLCGDAGKIKRVIGWEPVIKFDELVCIMMQADLDAVSKEVHGFKYESIKRHDR